MSKSNRVKTTDIYTIAGSQISGSVYVKNKMTVHFQGMSKTLQFPHTIALRALPPARSASLPRASTIA